MPKTYFVIGSYFGGKRLGLLLDRLDGVPHPDFAVLVNNQCGSERTPSGFTAIYNPLITAAFADKNCERVWILGDDVLPQFDCLVNTEEILKNDPTVGVIFPVEAWRVPDSIPQTVMPFTGVGINIVSAMQEGPEQIEQIFAGFACACITHAAWTAVGPMDESLGKGYCEDMDWGLRCWLAGYRVVNYRREYFLHERGATYNQLVADGQFAAQEPYDAGNRLKAKWAGRFKLWESTAEELLATLKEAYMNARQLMVTV